MFTVNSRANARADHWMYFAETSMAEEEEGKSI
jgi:hypothetical protein